MKSNVKDYMRAWGELLRLPNLLTVPGDVLAGFVVAGGGQVGFGVELGVVCAAVVLLYAAGLVMNDLVDVETDRRERSTRPLPSGRIAMTTARNVTGMMLAVAVVLLASRGISLLLAGTGLAAAVIFYTYRARRSRMVGAVVMGLCRAGSVGLGVAAIAEGAGIPLAAWGMMGAWWIFVAAISWVARREMQPGVYGPSRWWPSVALVIGVTILIIVTPLADGDPRLMRAVLSFVFAWLLVIQAGFQLGWRDRKQYPAAVGTMLSALLPMQAGGLVLFGQTPGALLVALLLLFAWPLHRLVAKRFAAS